MTPGFAGALPGDPDGRVAWDRDPVVAAWPGRPPLPGDVRVDAAVVGLGASGLAAIEALVARGMSVVGLDAGRVGAGAAGRNGGFLIAGPAPGLPAAVARWGRADATALYALTRDELRRTARALGPTVVRPCGSIRLAGLPGDPPDPAELADCEVEAGLLAELGVPVKAYDGVLGQGLELAGDGAVNPARRVVELATRSAGTLYERTPVLDIVPGLITTSRGTVRAEVIVVAVDGRLPELLPALSPLVRTARLQMLATAAVPPRLPGPVYARWGFDYAQQGATGLLFVGGCRDRFLEAEWTTSARPTAGVQAAIEDVAVRMAGGPVTVTDRWAASAGFTPDGRPVVGVLAGGVAVCGGYSGTGNLVGPVAARAAVAALLDGTPVPGWATTPVPGGGTTPVPGGGHGDGGGHADGGGTRKVV